MLYDIHLSSAVSEVRFREKEHAITALSLQFRTRLIVSPRTQPVWVPFCSTVPRTCDADETTARVDGRLTSELKALGSHPGEFHAFPRSPRKVLDGFPTGRGESRIQIRHDRPVAG